MSTRPAIASTLAAATALTLASFAARSASTSFLVRRPFFPISPGCSLVRLRGPLGGVIGDADCFRC